MPNSEPQVTRVLERLSGVIGKRLEMDKAGVDLSPESHVVIHAHDVRRLSIRSSSGEPFTEGERSLIVELAELLQREANLRGEVSTLDQRLRIMERENLDLTMKNRALADVSSRDALTGLYTRWYILDKIEAEMNRALRHGTPMSLLMIDIDHFRHVNDSHGHPAGDHVLQAVGQLLRDSCRVYDIPGRYGGEEFCLLLPETRIENTLMVAERVRARLAGTAIQAAHDTMRVTASIGVAGLENVPDEGLFNATSLIERADRALNVAKERGRNRVELWAPSFHSARHADQLDH